MTAEPQVLLSGLGWLPDGSLLVSCMLTRTVRRLGDDGLTVFADLAELTPWPLNDLVTDDAGRTFIGGFGYDYYGGAPFEPSPLYRIDPDGSVAVASEGLHYPNGCVVLPGGRTLVVAETMAARLAAFDIDASGDLVNRRVWAELPAGSTPDGICAATPCSC